MATKTKRKAQPWCACSHQVNKQLEKSNCQLATKLLMNFDTGSLRDSPPLLMVEKLAKSRKPMPTVICAYCPFCGTKYPTKE